VNAATGKNLKTVWILGAGFSRSLGGPLMGDLLRPQHLDDLRLLQGYRVAGRTPAKALYDLIAGQWLLPPMSNAAEEVSLAS
jgi:hypothetical protein